MSDFYDEDPNADPNVEAWDAAFYESPTAAATNLIDARLAQREMESYRYQDEQRVAANAAAMLQQAQQAQAEHAAGAAFAQTIDRSMTAAYGARFHEHSPAVGQRLAADVLQNLVRVRLVDGGETGIRQGLPAGCRGARPRRSGMGIDQEGRPDSVLAEQRNDARRE